MAVHRRHRVTVGCDIREKQHKNLIRTEDLFGEYKQLLHPSHLHQIRQLVNGVWDAPLEVQARQRQRPEHERRRRRDNPANTQLFLCTHADIIRV